MNQPVGGSFKIPWWLIVGAIGFLIFGGWKGFFGAIFGVLFLPIVLFVALAAGLFIWAYISGKRFTRFPGSTTQAPGSQSETTFKTRQHDGDIIETEATVIKRED